MERDRRKFENVTFPPFDEMQAAAFRAWWETDLYKGSAWFEAEWPIPEGKVARTRKFIGAPKWEFIPGRFWRVSAYTEVRGLSMTPLEPGRLVFASDAVTFSDAAAVASAAPSTNILLLKCDGADGSDIFVDSGGNNLVASNPGLGVLTTADKVFGTASGTFNVSPFIGDHIYYSSGNSIFDFGAGDWTIESFVKKTSTGSGWLYQFGGGISGGGLGLIDILFLSSTQMSVRFRDSSNTLVFNLTSSSFTAITNVWTHIAVVRYNDVVTIYVDGVSKGSAAFSAAHYWPPSDRNATIMAQVPETGSNSLRALIDSFRLSKGIAQYTSSPFTVPTSELTA